MDDSSYDRTMIAYGRSEKGPCNARTACGDELRAGLRYLPNPRVSSEDGCREGDAYRGGRFYYVKDITGQVDPSPGLAGWHGTTRALALSGGVPTRIVLRSFPRAGIVRGWVPPHTSTTQARKKRTNS